MVSTIDEKINDRMIQNADLESDSSTHLTDFHLAQSIRKSNLNSLHSLVACCE